MMPFDPKGSAMLESVFLLRKSPKTFSNTFLLALLWLGVLVYAKLAIVK